MLFLENIRLALFSLKANKMRSLLTMLGIIIGIAAVIAIITIGNSMTSSVESQMSSMGANNINVGIQQRSAETDYTEEGLVFEDENYMKTPEESDYITNEMLENYCSTYNDSIYAISASESLGSGKLVERNLYANVSLVGCSLGYFVANNIEFLSGRFFSAHETDSSSKVAIISDRAVKNMFDGDENAAIGSTVQVELNSKYYSFTVVGVYKYQNTMFGVGSGKNVVTDMYIPLRTAKVISHVEGYSMFTVMTKQGVVADDFAAETKRFFNSYYRNNRDFEIEAFSMASLVESMTDILSKITLAISVIGGIALLVGGIGVMNIMLVSITERTREIGTRKALGAPNSSIRLQFIVEAMIICLIGGMIGVVLGILVGMAAAALMKTSAEISITSIIVSLTFSMIIGVFFGYYPANKAAKMDPIEALRYE